MTEPGSHEGERPRIKVLLVEDHPMFRERLTMLINKELGMVVCAETDNTRTAMALIREHKPDVAIVDITLQGASGLELIKDLKAQEIPLPVLVLSMHEESLYAERVLRAGARGYIMKSEASSEVVKAIKKVIEGDVYLSGKMTAQVLDRMSHRRNVATKSVEMLTDRELEVFQLIGSAKTTREIARQLVLGETTVETYRARIKEKMGLRNAMELTQAAARWLVERDHTSARQPVSAGVDED